MDLRKYLLCLESILLLIGNNPFIIIHKVIFGVRSHFEMIVFLK